MQNIAHEKTFISESCIVGYYCWNEMHKTSKDGTQKGAHFEKNKTQ